MVSVRCWAYLNLRWCSRCMNLTANKQRVCQNYSLMKALNLPQESCGQCAFTYRNFLWVATVTSCMDGLCAVVDYDPAFLFFSSALLSSASSGRTPPTSLFFFQSYK